MFAYWRNTVENQGALWLMNNLFAVKDWAAQGLRPAMFAATARTFTLTLALTLSAGFLLPQTVAAQTDTTIVELRRQANAGDANAMARYGRAMALGEGITKNQEQAIDWLRKAAERGNVQGMYWYSTMLLTGEGVPANQPLAVSWLRRASENGHLSSMFTLAQAYATGQGIAQNLALAYAWTTIVVNAAPLQNPANNSLRDFKQRASDIQQSLAKSLDPQLKSRAEQQAAAWVIGTQPQLDAGSPTPPGAAPPSNTARPPSGPPNSPSNNSSATPGGGLSSGASAAPATLPATPAAIGLPPAPQPVPGADNPLNQRSAPIDPLRPRSDLSRPTTSSPGGTPELGQGAGTGAGVSAGLALRRISSGSAFFVTVQGALVTNHHVIKDCKQIRIIGGPEIKVMAIDAKEDLAVLIGPPLGKAVNFRASDLVSQGEEILSYGFPLQSVLATSGQIGAGLVSATSGLRNNASQLQVDVPLQIGNSGGPLLDRQGQLVGMSVAKLNALQMARVTGDVPQNVNFAIKHSVIKRFLESHRMPYQQTNNRGRLDTSAVADEARAYTVALECLV
jgi:uncharacterized protein